MRRPGPLQELPLEHFISSNPTIPTSPFKRSTNSSKRPLDLSPTAPTPYSPTKRRILSAEGVYSPSKSFKSAINRASVNFTDALKGQGSPARKLDFGLPKNRGSHTPSSSSTRKRSFPEPIPVTTTCPHAASLRTRAHLAASSEVLALRTPPTSAPNTTSAPSATSDTEMDDYFSPKKNASSSSSRATTIHASPLPSPHPQSAHYPGFLVFTDTHPALTRRIAESNSGSDSCDDAREKEKENLAPRRKTRKAVTAPASGACKVTMISPGGGKREVERWGHARSTPVTPKKISVVREIDGTPTPRSLRHFDPLKEQVRKLGRRIMEEEVDDAPGEDDMLL